jgi:hypothetical protein
MVRNDSIDDDTIYQSGLMALLAEPVIEQEPPTPEEKRERAFQKALDNTTPGKAGVPWEEKREIEGETEEELTQQLLDKILGETGRNI